MQSSLCRSTGGGLDVEVVRALWTGMLLAYLWRAASRWLTLAQADSRTVMLGKCTRSRSEAYAPPSGLPSYSRQQGTCAQ